MLQHHLPGHHPEQIWVDKLQPRLDQLRAALAEHSVERIAEHSGADLREDNLHLTMLFNDYVVDPADYTVRRTGGDQANSLLQSLVLTYINTADGTPPAGRWIGFRELPDGTFYQTAFQGYAPDRLTKHWGLDLEGFKAACRALGGTPIGHGEAGFGFRILPRLEIAAVYWLGDQELPSKASLLFDANAHHYMVVDGLAILGSHLVDRLLASGAAGNDG